MAATHSSRNSCGDGGTGVAPKNTEPRLHVAPTRWPAKTQTGSSSTGSSIGKFASRLAAESADGRLLIRGWRRSGDPPSNGSERLGFREEATKGGSDHWTSPLPIALPLPLSGWKGIHSVLPEKWPYSFRNASTKRPCSVSVRKCAHTRAHTHS